MMRFLLWLALMVTIAGTAAAQVDLPTAHGLIVHRVDIDNPTQVKEREIRDLFLLRPGDPYSPNRVQRSLYLLARKVEIRNVVVRGQLVDGGLVLRLQVEAAPLVYSVKIRGEGPVDEDHLRATLRTRVDHPLVDADLRRDESALAEAMAQEGYPNARVRALYQPAPRENWHRVVFEIEAGDARRIGRIDVPAELPLEPWRLRALLGLAVGDPAAESRLRSGVKRLEAFLRHRDMGYPEAKVRRPQFAVDGAAEATAVLPLHLGPYTEFRFEGVEEWGARQLYPVYKARFGEPIDEVWLQSVAEEMQQVLHRQGYPAARVRARVEQRGAARRVVYRVERDGRVYVHDVVFSGNRNLSSSRLRRYMSLLVGGLPLSRPLFTRAALDRDRKVLANYYASKGYLDAKITVTDEVRRPGGEIVLYLQVEEGKSYRWGAIHYHGEVDWEEEELLRITGLRRGRRADPGALERARGALLKALAEQGRSRAEVRYRSEKRVESGEVGVVFEIVGGPAEYVGKIIVSGNVRTQTKVILRELTFSPGDPWNPEEIGRSRRRIYRLGYFRSVRIGPLPAALEGGRRDVVIAVEEQDAGSITFGLGYGSEEGIKGSASLGHANLFGYGRSLNFRARFDDFEQSYAVNFREPWLFNRRLDLRLSLVKSYQDRDAYNLSSLGFQPALEKEFSERFRGSMLYTLEQDRLSSVRDPAVVNDNNLNDYLLSAIGPVLAWDSRDDPFNPRWGQYHTVKVEWAMRALGSQVTYNRYSAGLSVFGSVGTHTLALYAGGGLAQRFGDTVEIPLNKRFFIGGRDTVRGYARDQIGPTARDGTPVGGDTLLNAKVEWRYPLWRSLRGVAFWDAGNVWNRALENPDYQRLRHGAGAGLRYVTPVGPLSLDLAWKIKRRAGEDLYRLHFTVGNVF